MDLDFFVRIAKVSKLDYLPVHLARFRSYRGQKSRSGDEKIYKEYYKEINRVVLQNGAARFNNRLVNQKMQKIRRFILRNFFPVHTLRYTIFRKIKNLI